MGGPVSTPTRGESELVDGVVSDVDEEDGEDDDIDELGDMDRSDATNVASSDGAGDDAVVAVGADVDGGATLEVVVEVTVAADEGDEVAEVGLFDPLLIDDGLSVATLIVVAPVDRVVGEAVGVTSDTEGCGLCCPDSESPPTGEKVGSVDAESNAGLGLREVFAKEEEVRKDGSAVGIVKFEESGEDSNGNSVKNEEDCCEVGIQVEAESRDELTDGLDD